MKDGQNRQPIEASLDRVGGGWKFGFFGQEAFVPNWDGVIYLRPLLANPHRSFSALALRQLRGCSPTETPSWGEGAPLRISELDDTQARSDPQAIAEYRRRLHELQVQRAESEAMNDQGRLAAIADEASFLSATLEECVKGHHTVSFSSQAAKATASVSKAIKRLITNISSYHFDLGRHLDVAIRHRRTVWYAPDPILRIRWRIDWR